MTHSQPDPQSTRTNLIVHYVIVDFEATCAEPFNPEPQEIIEFPAVIVSPDGQIVDEFLPKFARLRTLNTRTAATVELSPQRVLSAFLHD